MYIDTSSPPPADSSRPTNQKLSGSSAELVKLASDLGLQPKQKLLALVNSISSISQEERSLIMQLKREQGTSAQTLKSWEKTLNDPNLKHVELKVRQQIVQALTSIPLTKNQEVKIELTHFGLKLTKDIAPEGTLQRSEARPPAQNLKPSADLQKAQSNINQLLKHNQSLDITPKLSAPRVQTTSAASTTTAMLSKNIQYLDSKIALREALSKTLPISEPHQKLLNTIEKLTTELNQFLSKNPQNSVSSHLKQLSQILSTSARSPSLHINRKSPPTASALEHAVKNSGSFYEQKIMKSVRSQTANGLPMQIPFKSSVTSAMETPSRIADKDLKGLFIQLSSWLASNSATPIPTPTGAKSKTDDAVTKLLQSLMLAINPRQSAPPEKTDFRLLNQELQKLVQQSIARIQLQQYKTLNSLSQETTNTTSNTVYFDLPVKTPDGYINIYIQLFEPKIKEEQNSNKKQKSPKTHPKWRLFMELELDDEGSLAVELSICDKKMNATFWSEKESLRRKAENQFEQLRLDLESKGLCVTDLRCSENTPPNQKMYMGYSLIDIKT